MIKYLILLLSLSAFANTSTPRDTMRTFLKSMVKVKTNIEVNESYKKAYSTIKPQYKGELNASQKKTCDELITTFDKIEKVNYENIPEKTDLNKWIYDKRNYNGEGIEISLIKTKKNGWIFSKNTINSLDEYYDYFENKNTVEGVVKLERTSDKIKKSLPPIFRTEFLFLELWQWSGIFAYILLAYILELIAKFILRAILSSKINFFKQYSKIHLEKVMKPFGRLFFLLLLNFGIQYLDFRLTTFTWINKLLLIATTIVFIWLLKKIVEIASFAFLEKAKETDSKFDDILVPLVAKTAYILVYILGGFLVAHHLEIDVTGIVAGLGIGGLAFAFAAKDTLANFFGSIMLVLDRPFDIGDVITAGDVEGVVLEVGFRSTRIRTFYDSVITISNGALVSRSIDNKGKRRYRRLTTTLGVEYNTPPKKIEAFCEGIRQIILSHKWTRKDNFNVYFANFGPSSLDIALTVYWETAEFSRELAEKHRLMIDILRLSKEMDISFAFPTQTLHLFNEEQQAQIKEEDAYIEEGINKAKVITKTPLSLKNPRSNLEDKSQFGDNDIGID